MSSTSHADSKTKKILRYMVLTFLDEGKQTNEEYFRSFVTLDDALQYVRDYQSITNYSAATIREIYEEGTFSKFRYLCDFDDKNHA